jgi:molybdopterin converting factor small subunit
MATVRIPTPLRTLTGGADEVTADGATVRAVIEHLEAKHPGIRERLLDDKGVRRFVNIYLGDEDIRFLGGLDTEVKAADQLSVVPAIAGGLASSGARSARALGRARAHLTLTFTGAAGSFGIGNRTRTTYVPLARGSGGAMTNVPGSDVRCV